MTGFKSKRSAARERYGMIVEDPFYDEDGVMIDEDGVQEVVAEKPQELDEIYSPYFGA